MANIFKLFNKISGGSGEQKPTVPVTYIIAGLGNPGYRYEGTRHNAGFMAIDHIASRAGVKIDTLKYKSLCADATFTIEQEIKPPKAKKRKPRTPEEAEIFKAEEAEEAARLATQMPKIEKKHIRAILLKPQTLMNRSGAAVAEAAAFYKIPPERIIVICDDISLDPGCVRIRRKGSAGGHNGLKDINECLGSETYPRIKIGIGQKPHPDYDLADWVLGAIPKSDREKISSRFPDIYEGLLCMLAGDIDGAMQKCN